MANKISVILDVATDKAIGGLKGFKQSIADADGAVGKFKAGAGSAFDSIKGQAGNMALVAGAAIVTFGVKAIGAFQDTALAAGKFADATGLSTEAASRWVAVADDIGISGESMEKSFGKLAVSVGKNNPLLEEYGITVQKNALGQADMNETMLHAIDVIKGIQDPTKKAAVAQAALGKGWMEMAELIEQGSGSLTESMGEVSEAQVIDPEEVERARKMRESMDNLQDSVRDLSLALGEELVPTVAMMADGLTALITPLMAVNKWSKDVTLQFMEFTGIIDKQKAAIDPLIYGYGRMLTVLDATTDSTGFLEEVMGGFNQVIEESVAETEKAEEAQDRLEEAEQRLIRTTEELTNRYRDLKGELSEEEDFHNAEAMWAELAQSATDSYNAAAAGAEDAAAKAFDHESRVIDAKQAVVDLGEKYRDLPAEKITNIVALIDQGKLAEAEAAFNNLTRNRTMNVDIVSRGGAGYDGGRFGTGATGGIVTRPTMALIGEAGPEAVVPLNQMPGASPLNGGGSVTNVTINMPPGSNGDDVVRAIQKFERRNGPGWRAS